MKKKFIFVLSLIILLPLTVSAAGGNISDGIYWNLNDNGELYILGNVGIIPDYEEGTAPWYEYADSIKSVTVYNGIRSIGEYAFWGLTNLAAADIPGSVTYIAETAFDNYDYIFFNTDYNTYAYNFFKEHSPAFDCGGIHLYTGWVITTEPTYTEEGVQKRGCMRCYTEETMTVPVRQMGPVYMTTEGNGATLHNLSDVRDIFYARGDHHSYRDVKNNMVYSIGSKKLGDATEYSYTFSGKGMHTIYIRFNDPSKADRIFTVNVIVKEPTFTHDALKLTVGNLEGVKVIRTAVDEHDTVRSMKTSGTIRNFTGSIIRDVEDYTLKFTENGIYTVAVEYTSGYVKIYKCVVYGQL